MEARAREHTVAELLDGTKLMEARLVRHLSKKQQLGAHGTVVAVASIQAVLDAVVDVFRVLELLLVDEVTAR